MRKKDKGGSRMSVTLRNLQWDTISAKNMILSATKCLSQSQNKSHLLRLEAFSKNLTDLLEDLGKKRVVITKNFSVFIEAFEQIKKIPELLDIKDTAFPPFNFGEIGNLYAFAAKENPLRSVTAATSGINAAINQTKSRSPYLLFIPTNKEADALALLTLGSMLHLNVTKLITSIAVTHVDSVAKKQANEDHKIMPNNETIINDAIDMQLSLFHLADEMKSVSVDIFNNVYKPIVLKLKELVSHKKNWKRYKSDEKKLVENAILVVQILHYLNNTPLYKITKMNDEGKVEEVEANAEEVKEVINNAQQGVKGLRSNYKEILSNKGMKAGKP